MEYRDYKGTELLLNSTLLLIRKRKLIPCDSVALPVAPNEADLGELPLELYSMGWHEVHWRDRRVAWDNRARATPRPQPFCLFQILLSGGVLFADKDGERRMHPGDAFLIPLPSPTAYRLPENESWEWLYLCFGGTAAVSITRRINAGLGYTFRLPDHAEPLHDMVELYRRALHRELPSRADASAAVYQLMMKLLLCASHSMPSMSPPVAAALRYIDAHLAEPELSLEAIAGAACLSRFHFLRTFKAALGIAPMAYVTSRRMERAAELLTMTQRSVKQVAAATGFAHVSYFCTAFRRYFGHAPRKNA